MQERIFVKIGGSYITDKTRPDSLMAERVRKIAKAISLALIETDLELVLAHGGGCYGHIKAEQYRAQQGIDPEYGWQPFYQIRQDMMHLNLRFVQLVAEENLFPITVQPSAVTIAKAGKIYSMNLDVIRNLLDLDQIPLLHGDIVLDEQQGFTIVSTEDLLSFLSRSLHFQRVIMISDVPGVLDAEGKIIPVIKPDNFNDVMAQLGKTKGADVTGGMKGKVEQLYSIIRQGNITTAAILSGKSDIREIKKAITGKTKAGTIII